ncbi:hypothetical protein DPX16_7115 [Anabarilius grahami]|uniref:Uncharacterized protein n=1 Tax=Anabarilius grahami TaxID=495550 RepID=A0A3N0XWP2_ANAGA|nr:hypothetical protein DPX16_7115 [Anabarilius grahami]
MKAQRFPLEQGASLSMRSVCLSQPASVRQSMRHDVTKVCARGGMSVNHVTQVVVSCSQSFRLTAEAFIGQGPPKRTFERLIVTVVNMTAFFFHEGVWHHGICFQADR